MNTGRHVAIPAERGQVRAALFHAGCVAHDLAIATRRKTEVFHDLADFDAFYDGYAGRRITEVEKDYFLVLYEFF